MASLLRTARRPSRRLGSLLLLATASVAAAALVGSNHATAGGSNRSSPAARAGDVGVQIVSANRKLKSTTIYSDMSDLRIPGGFQRLHAPITIACASRTTCTYEADQYQQIVSPTSEPNGWKVCTLVDGQVMREPDCPVWHYAAGSSFTDEVRTFSQSQSGIQPGAHTVQSFIYSEKGIYDLFTKITYRVYTP